MVLVKQILKKILLFLGLYKSNNIWPKATDKKMAYFKKHVKIKTSIETINDIKETIQNQEKGAYLRFGDGDIYLMLGLDDILHKKNKHIAKEMKQAFQVSKGEIHKALAIHSKLYGYEEGMRPDMHLLSDQKATDYLMVTDKYFTLNQIYTPVALHHLATYDRGFCISFLKFLKGTCPIFVGNENYNSEFIKKFFGGEHIKTPSENSYSEMDRIEKELIEVINSYNGQFIVVVVAMGCPGRILQKRILKKGFNVYLFDYGSLLDALNGDNSRLWIDLAGAESFKEIHKAFD